MANLSSSSPVVTVSALQGSQSSSTLLSVVGSTSFTSARQNRKPLFLLRWFALLRSLLLALIEKLPVLRDKSASGHSVTLREKVSVSSVEISGASAYEVSGMISPMCCMIPVLVCETSELPYLV